MKLFTLEVGFGRYKTFALRIKHRVKTNQRMLPHRSEKMTPRSESRIVVLCNVYAVASVLASPSRLVCSEEKLWSGSTS